METKRRIAASFLAVCATVAGCDDTEDVPGNVLAAYVLLGPSSSDGAVAHARVIVSAAADVCPELVGQNERRAMRFRRNPHGFAVRVCEAVVPFDAPFVVAWNGQALPVASRDPSRILLFGDTGCDAKDCTDGEPATPFRHLAAEASALSPELVLHVGDYNYRGTPGEVGFAGGRLPVYDAGDDSSSPKCQLDQAYVSQNAGFSDQRDGWEAWRVDFFEPARPLLASAPFVFARGNHELCSRAGPGWFYFLDASHDRDGAGQLSCPPQGGEEPPSGGVLSRLAFTEPRIVELGRLRVVVLDSANACDAHAPAATVALYREQLGRVFERLDGETTTWVLTHRPFWGLEEIEASGPETINHTLRAALGSSSSEGSSFPSSVRLLVAGHMHLFQSLTFNVGGAGSPPQIVVGNGGVKTASGPGRGEVSLVLDGEETNVLTETRHGFTTIPDLAVDGSWRGEVVNPHEKEVLAECAQPVAEGCLCVPAS